MKENKKSSKGLIILIIILIICVLGLGGYIVYDKMLDNSNINNEKINQTEKKQNNNYELYASNLKQNISEKYDSNNLNYQYVLSEIIKDGYEVYLTKENELYIKYYNKELFEKYGQYKISNKVLNFYIVSTGQAGGNTLYFINMDGTVGSADIEYNIENNSQIIIKKDLGYKNIVSIINGMFGDENSGVKGPIFIDINGNLFGDNLK